MAKSQRQKIREAYGLRCDPATHKTQQSHKDQCDINRVLDRARHGASLSHILNHGGQYGDFSDWDENTYENMRNELAQAEHIFWDLPAEIRMNEFANNPGKFFSYVNDPANADKLPDLLPALAAPGRQLPDVIGGAQAAAEAPPAPSAAPVGASDNEPPQEAEQPG